jgi:hypothetical protein
LKAIISRIVQTTKQHNTVKAKNKNNYKHKDDNRQGEEMQNTYSKASEGAMKDGRVLALSGVIVLFFLVRSISSAVDCRG